MRTLLVKDILKSDIALPVTKICQSWQEVEPGAVFIAIKGQKFDGHDFLDKAEEGGAAISVISDKSKMRGDKTVLVPDTRIELSRLSAMFYEEPSKKLMLVGLTGTNGKTTTNWMTYHLLLSLGKGAARLGTLGFECTSGKHIESREGDLTTPDALSIHRDLAYACEHDAEAAVLEISSHALDQYRANDLHLDVAVYSNLTRDHLDYHKDMQSYFNVKAEIFTLLAKSEKKKKLAVINLDCEYGEAMQKKALSLGLNCLTFGKNPSARLHIKEFSQDLSGSKICFKVDGNEHFLESKFIGQHNAENAAAAIGSALGLGFNVEVVLKAFSSIPQVPGRLESTGTKEIGIFVDYAHTPDALENVLCALKPLVKNDLWVIFGCGGDRDKGKRPIMAAISAKYADKVVVTSDNPRTENAEEIIKDILSSGISYELKESDRRLAIEKTVKAAKPGDIVLIAGKGHENYQIIGTEKRHFSDVEEVRRSLNL